MFSHLLVPLDGSDLAEQALATAEELAEKFESTITLVHVLVNVPHASLMASDSHDAIFDRIRREAYENAVEYLGRIGDTLRQKGVEAHYHFIEGRSAAEAILSAVETTGADTIVMSTHGRSGFDRWVFGSVAEKVLRGASVPVVLIR